MRVLSVADSDSYLKWSHALLASLRGGTAARHGDDQGPHHVHEVVLGNVLSPSAAQVRAATGGALPRLDITGVVRRVQALRPDVVVVACTGPALEVVVAALHAAGLLGPASPGRPVLVSGFPGVTVPANELALRFRRHLDLVLVHSRRELREHRALAHGLGVGTRFALATLPFLHGATGAGATGAGARGAGARGADATGSGTDVVFAAQSLVPPGVAERRAILAALARVPAALTPVVKVRALAGERQAHNERFPYAGLDPDPRIVFRAGSMRDALADAAGCVTVSSTAVLEAVALGVPSLVLGDFGVDDAMITAVFAGSGLIGDLADLRAGRFRAPDPAWLADNYFHDRSEDTWRTDLERLVAAPREPVRFRPFQAPAQRLRRWARLAARPGFSRA